MKFLFLIPARGGSKGIPGKNIKPLNGIPLIRYSLDYARNFATDADICVSTDDPDIIQYLRGLDYHVPFVRPQHLATDIAGSYGVLTHAVNYYKEIGVEYDAVVLLQPTSPFRKKELFKDAVTLFSRDIDMVISVIASELNPYYNMLEENQTGFLQISKGPGNFERRQDAPTVYASDGALYIINTDSLLNNHSFAGFSRKKKVINTQSHIIDLDTLNDWAFAEYLCKHNSI